MINIIKKRRFNYHIIFGNDNNYITVLFIVDDSLYLSSFYPYSLII